MYFTSLGGFARDPCQRVVTMKVKSSSRGLTRIYKIITGATKNKASTLMKRMHLQNFIYAIDNKLEHSDFNWKHFHGD